jgi:hypothetical protein
MAIYHNSQTLLLITFQQIVKQSLADIFRREASQLSKSWEAVKIETLEDNIMGQAIDISLHWSNTGRQGTFVLVLA